MDRLILPTFRPLTCCSHNRLRNAVDRKLAWDLNPGPIQFQWPPFPGSLFRPLLSPSEKPTPASSLDLTKHRDSQVWLAVQWQYTSQPQFDSDGLFRVARTMRPHHGSSAR